MPLTNLPDGVTSFGIPLPSGGLPAPFTGNYYFVQEPPGGAPAAASGSGAVDNPYTTLAAALAKAIDGNNDVIVLIGTVHLTSTLVWNKSNTHLIGACAPLTRGKRARISTQGTAGFTPMVSVTGNGCFFSNFGTFYGIASNSALVAWSDTGGRNCYNNVEFMGFGSSNTAAQAGSRALVMNGSTGESSFYNCVFGVDTVARTAANYTLEIAGGSPRNYFDGCTFEGLFTGGGTSGGHLLIGASGIDRYAQFVNCRFLSDTKSTGSALTQAFSVNASAGGVVLCKDSWFLGITNVETTAGGCVFMTMPTAASSDSGLAIVNAP